MDSVVYRVVTVLCGLVAPFPLGTNRALLGVFWMLLSGRLLAARGALIPALTDLGWAPDRVRRAWVALGQGAWTSDRLLTRWRAVVAREGQWQAHRHDGYQPVAVDLTGFWRPRLRDCPTRHYHSAAGKALPAIPVGIVARVGSVGTQRLGVPLAFVRADAADPSVAAHERGLLHAAVRAAADRDVLVCDAGFEIRQLQEAGATRYVVRAARNVTGRRAGLADYPGRGRPRTRGELIRPLARTYRGRELAATTPDHAVTWQAGDAVVRADWWADLILPDVPLDSPTFRLIVIHDPRWTEPLVLATPLAISARALRDLYLDRWPVEQLPLAAKQMLGAARAFVSAPETCQRLPELALLAGSILTYLAATLPAVPTGSWDRRPRPTPGRLRRVLAHTVFPTSVPLPDRIRQKAAVTAHLPTGPWGQRRRPTPIPDPSGATHLAFVNANVA